MNSCLECGKEISSKAKYCNDSCKQKAYRKRVSELLRQARNKDKQPYVMGLDNIKEYKGLKEPPKEFFGAMKEDKGVKKVKPEPPAGLKGIDLSIWKEENGW